MKYVMPGGDARRYAVCTGLAIFVGPLRAAPPGYMCPDSMIAALYFHSVTFFPCAIHHFFLLAGR